MSSGRQPLALPFDPDEVVDNLRLERYLEGAKQPRLLKSLYYKIRPFTNLAARRAIQGFHARNWKKRVFPRWPVDTTVEDLAQKLLVLSMQAQGVKEVPFIWFWPDGARSALIMTHDVENPDGRDYCGALMDLNDAYGLKASFQIVPEERYQVTEEFLDSIRSRGFDVAIQDLNHDGLLYDDRDQFEQRAKKINQHGKRFGAAGFRAAVLYRKPEWFGALDFAFDMSFPTVAPMDPQYGGCCTVTPYFIGDLVELPVTTVQDYTLFHVLNERTIDLWKLQMELVLRKNGLISFIVHPDYIIDPSTRAVYEDLLRYISGNRNEQGIWCARPAQVNEWWRERSRMTLRREAGRWRIAGKGSERAVLAVARLVNDNLVYDLAGSQEGLVGASVR